MKGVTVFVALCALLVLLALAEAKPTGPILMSSRHGGIAYNAILPSEITALMGKSPVRTVDNKDGFTVLGPAIEDIFSCSELHELFSAEKTSDIVHMAHCSTSRLSKKSSASLSTWSYYDAFAAKVKVVWPNSIDVHIHEDIFFSLFDLWANGYYLRDSITHCYVPLGKDSKLGTNVNASAVLLAFPHSIGKIPEATIKGWSGLKIFETFYYKTLVEINELTGKGWLYSNKYVGDDRIAPIYAEYSRYESQGLSLDNYKKWLVMPFRILSVTQPQFSGIPMDLKRQRNINTIFMPDSMNMQDGVIDSMKTVYGNVFKLTDDEKHNRVSDRTRDYCSVVLPDISDIGAWYPYYRLRTRYTMNSLVSTNYFLIYNCALSLIEDGFSVVPEKEKISDPSNQYTLIVGPRGMEFNQDGVEITDILYRALRKLVKEKFRIDISPTPDGVAFLRSILQDETLVECYSINACNSIHVKSFPQLTCHSTYKDKNGVIQDIEQRIVEGCTCLSYLYTKDELHVWTTLAEHNEMKQSLTQKGQDFIGLEVGEGEFAAVIIIKSDLVRAVRDSYSLSWPSERIPFFTRLRTLVELQVLMDPFCRPMLVNAGLNRLMCVSNDKIKMIPYETFTYLPQHKDYFGFNSFMIAHIVNLPNALDNGRYGVWTETTSCLSKLCDMTVFDNIKSTLAEIDKEIVGQSKTFNVLWKLRQMLEKEVDAKKYTQSGVIVFKPHTSYFQDALSLFSFSQRSGISFNVYRCRMMTDGIQCDSASNSFPMPHIGRNPSREELLYYMDVHTKLGELLWDDRSKIVTVQYDRYTITPSESESKAANHYLYLFINACMLPITSTDDSLENYISPVENLKIADVRRAIVQVMNGEHTTGNSLANSISSMLSYSRRSRLGVHNLLTVTFSTLSRERSSSSTFDALVLVGKLQEAGMDVNLKTKKSGYKLLLDIAVSEEYTKVAAKLTNDAVFRVTLSKIMQGLRLNELLQEYMDGLVVQLVEDGELIILPTERVHEALQKKDNEPNTPITNEDKDLMVLSMIGKQLFPWKAELFNSYSNLRTILKSFKIGNEADIYSTLNSLVVGSSKSMDFAKQVLKIVEQQYLLNAGNIVSAYIISKDPFMRAHIRSTIIATLKSVGLILDEMSNTHDSKDHSTNLMIGEGEHWGTRLGLIKKVLELTNKLARYGIVVRPCPGKRGELFSIQIAGPFNSKNVRHYFEGKCVEKDPREEDISEFIQEMLHVLQPQEDHEKSHSIMQHVDLGNIDDYVLQSIGFIASYMGPNRGKKLEMLNLVELNEFKSEIGFPMDGSMTTKDLESAWQEVEELGIKCNEPYADDYTAAPMTLSVAAQVAYRILHMQMIDRCPICLTNMFVADDLAMMLALCGHAMHKECCTDELMAGLCPMCRTTLHPRSPNL